MKSQGIILLALKHPFYAKMAQNLAISIKNASPNMNISLAHDHTLSTDINTGLFDELIEVPPRYRIHDGLEHPIKAKTFLYNLSPYKETIFLDADMIWCPYKKPEDLFTEIDGDFCIQNTGVVDLDKPFNKNASWWSNDLHDVKEKYKLKGLYYHLSSEVIYFKKSKEVKKIFDTAQKLYDFKADYKPFAGGVPDELLFGVALAKLNINIKSSWIPSYWQTRQTRYPSRNEIYTNYYLYSIGGKIQTPQAQKIYNDLVQVAYKKAGYMHPFLLTKATEKRTWLPERNHI